MIVRITTERVEEIVERWHQGDPVYAVGIDEFADFAADLLDARKRIAELEEQEERYSNGHNAIRDCF